MAWRVTLKPLDLNKSWWAELRWKTPRPVKELSCLPAAKDAYFYAILGRSRSQRRLRVFYIGKVLRQWVTDRLKHSDHQRHLREVSQQTSREPLVSVATLKLLGEQRYSRQRVDQIETLLIYAAQPVLNL